MQNLQIGQKIIFSKVPVGSYLKADVIMEIEDITDKTVYFVDPATKGKTDVSKIDLQYSAFEII